MCAAHVTTWEFEASDLQFAIGRAKRWLIGWNQLITDSRFASMSFKITA